MDEMRLKQVMERVHIKTEMEEEILKNLQNNQLNEEPVRQKRGRKTMGWQKRVAVAAIALVVVGTVGVSAGAVMNSFVKQRMEEIPEEEIQNIVEEIDAAQVDADTYSRELTAEERERMTALHSEYLSGKFPESELTVVEDQSRIDKEILCYASDTAYFNIPERDLTDEELLQMIDFNEKREYALQKRYEEEYADEIAEQKAAEQAEKQTVEEEGGITEEEAVIKATGLLENMFGKTADGMELNHYMNTTEEAAELGQAGPTYVVCYSVMGDYYYFTISANNGNPLEITHSYDGLIREEIKATDAEAKIETTYQAAEDYLKNKLGITEENVEVYYSYMKSGDGESVYMNTVSFYFVKEDGSCHMITCLSDDDSFFRYCYLENYEEHLAEQKESDESMINGPVAESGTSVSERVTAKLK